MLKVSVLTSGSKGNCILICSEKCKILVDAGITFKKVNEFMQFFNLDPMELDAVIISHEHSDHVQGAGVLSRKTQAPIYITQNTLQESLHKIGKLNVDPVIFYVGSSFQIKDIIVKPFTSSHDAVDSSNFLISHVQNEDRKLAIATDLGYSPQILINYLKQASTIILESNHDVKMLMEGPYPWPLKQRIKSKIGHLSNDQAVGVVSQIMSDKLDKLFLAHLSETNNSPKIAYDTMRNYLLSIQAKTALYMTSQEECTPLLDV